MPPPRHADRCQAEPRNRHPTPGRPQVARAHKQPVREPTPDRVGDGTEE